MLLRRCCPLAEPNQRASDKAERTESKAVFDADRGGQSLLLNRATATESGNKEG
jgi:hypothetical protein